MAADEPGAVQPLDIDALVDELESPSEEEVSNDEGVKESDAEVSEGKADDSSKSDDKSADGADDESGSSEEDNAGSDTDDEGYTIDGDDDGSGDTDEGSAPSNSTGKSPEGDKRNTQLSPEQQYILDNIQPIKVEGVVGDSDKVKTYDVFTPEQLPAGFKFLDDRSREIASKQFGMLESRARELQTDYRQQESKKAADAFKAAEDAADRSEIGDLQREGVLPKFKVDVDSPEFDKDPAAELIQAVLDFKEEQNAKYLQAANSGKRYKHIGFEEAYYMYVRKNPDAVTKKSPEQAKEDSARKDHARRTKQAAGAPAKGKAAEPSIFHNSRDMMNYLDNLELN